MSSPPPPLPKAPLCTPIAPPFLLGILSLNINALKFRDGSDSLSKGPMIKDLWPPPPLSDIFQILLLQETQVHTSPSNFDVCSITSTSCLPIKPYLPRGMHIFDEPSVYDSHPRHTL